MNNTKFLPFFLLLFLSFQTSFAQGKLVFKTMTHNFGTFTEGTEADYTFEMQNDGDAPVTISEVEPSCGCTSPKWTRKPLQPGESGIIRVMYDSEGRPGAFRKSIKVLSDAAQETMVLYIEGMVEPRVLNNGIVVGNIMLEREIIDFGEIAEGGEAIRKFVIKNTSNRPIKIKSTEANFEGVSVAYPSYPIFLEETMGLTIAIDRTKLEPNKPFDITLMLQTNDNLNPDKSIRLRGTFLKADLD